MIPSSEGMVPVNWLVFKESAAIDVGRLVGMVPVMEFPDRANQRSLDMFEISVGIVPVS